MDIRTVTPTFAALPRQLTVADVPALAAAGFVRILNNRPDEEAAPEDQGAAIAAACQAAGLDYVANPCGRAGISREMIAAQRAALDAPGPVLGYCRSGTRSTTLWALAQAGSMPVDEIIATAAKAGYDLAHLRGMIDALAEGRG